MPLLKTDENNMQRLSRGGDDLVELSNPMNMKTMAGKSGSPSLKNYKFSPFKYNDDGRERVGVPGHKLYSQTSAVLRGWRGTSFQEVIKSGLFRAYSGFFCILIVIFSLSGYNNTLRAMTILDGLQTAINRLCVFTLTFFMTSTVSKVFIAYPK
jgi:hypothetical protein